MIEEEWTGCYKTHRFDCFRQKESYAHPAKMANGLLERIFKFLMKQGLLKFGDTVLDPMAGIGTTALGWCSMHPDNRAITVELEEKFIKMQQENKALAEKVLQRPMNWIILQGDARRLSELLNERGLIGVTSPPYIQSVHGRGQFDDDKLTANKHTGPHSQARNKDGYGATEGNIGNLPDQPLGNLKDKPVIITSPPYADAIRGGEGPNVPEFFEWAKAQCGGQWPIPNERMRELSNQWQREHEGYSTDPENIGNLKDKPITITSPPYEDALEFKADNYDKLITEQRRRQKEGEMAGHPSTPEAELRYIKKMKDGRPEDPNNIGKNKGESYLEAMSVVYEEIAKVCNVVVTVTKNPTRNGKLRRLDLDTEALLKANDLTVLAWIKARLFTVIPHCQTDLSGTAIEQKGVKGRLSFFKRISLRKGNVVADHEDVLVAIRLKENEFP